MEVLRLFYSVKMLTKQPKIAFTIQIWKTKVFLRAGQMDELDVRRTKVLGNSAKIIQCKVRSYIAQK